MGIFRLMLMAGIAGVALILNVQLAIFGESLNVYSRTISQGAVRECFYYRPVEIFTVETDPENVCPQRISSALER
ncbi:MAG: hypothetical protein RL735_592 [Pseudomonadota bacterium]